MLNSFMPDSELVEIHKDNNVMYQISVHCEFLELPCIYDITCDYDTKRNKVYWIVFKRALIKLPSMRVNRWRISLRNYPTNTLEEAIRLAHNEVINNLRGTTNDLYYFCSKLYIERD